MPKTRQQKVEMLAGLQDRLARMSGAVLADFATLKMHDLEDLRKRCRAESCEFLVVKKTLLKRAAEAESVPLDAGQVEGSVSILAGFEDAITPAKIAKRYAKEHEAFRVYGGFIREESGVLALDADSVRRLGDLPSRDELIAKAVGSIAAPLRGLVGVLQGNLRGLVGVLSAIQQSKV
ncbi:MAG: 50S ribosomal protein L10 [Candidatus Uhrbacteria bacterium]